jgi:hypothetical protein
MNYPESRANKCCRSNHGQRTLFCCFLLASTFCFRTAGQNYSINWYKVAGGGGMSSNGQYSVSGTVGQPDAGSALTSGSYSLTGGFWALFAEQTPGLPYLTILHSGDNVIVSWPNTGSYTLQQNAGLAGGSWITSSNSITTANGTNSITISPPAGNRFFRLSNP